MLNQSQLGYSGPPAAFAVLAIGADSRGAAGGRIGLLDYGQSKQLPTRVRLALARLILAMEPGTEAADSDLVAACVRDLGLKFERTDNRLQAAMAAGMFDSRLSHKCAPDAAVTELLSIHWRLVGWAAMAAGRFEPPALAQVRP